MMRKYLSRLLALVLVLSMVVLCVPVRAQAVDMTRPEGLTDEEWDELLRLRLLEEAEKAAEAALTDPDTLTKSDSGDVVVTEQVTVPGAPNDAKNQTVSVEVPLNVGEISADGTTNQYDVVITEETTTDGVTTEVTVPVTVEESFDLVATDPTVETTPEGDVTDITYDVALSEHITAEKQDGTKVANSNLPNVDRVMNQIAKDEKTAAPAFKVDLSVNGMEDAPTRVEHKYYETDADAESNTNQKVEYYYNEANVIGEKDPTKNYFTIAKEKVISLVTNFLGIFHITNDAFEGSEQTDGTKDTYSNLSDAAVANSGKTVEMLRDYETDTSASITNGTTLDLNDHTYSYSGSDAAVNVSGTGANVAIQNGNIVNTAASSAAVLEVGGSGNTVTVDDAILDGSGSTFGAKVAGTGKNLLRVLGSGVWGKTGISLSNADAEIDGSYVGGITGAAVEVDGNSADNDVIITSGWFESGAKAADISAKDKDDSASITVKGGHFTDPDGLYDYLSKGYAVISHNDGSDFPYEVVKRGYTPTREGYKFLGYTDAKGNAITLEKAYEKGVVAYAQWKKLTSAKPVPLIIAKTDEKGCTTKITTKGDTAFVSVKDAEGEFAPISEVTVTSVRLLQNKKIDTIEIQVDEDVTLVLDIEKAKENGFTDTIEVTLEKDTLTITSGEDTCIEMDIEVLKASEKPVEIQLVEGELTVLLGKKSSLSADLTKALETGERIVVKLQNGVLKLYDKYNKPIKD